MSDLDEIGVYRPDRVAAVLWTGEQLTERDLRNFKANPDPKVGEWVDWVRQTERSKRWLAERRSR